MIEHASPRWEFWIDRGGTFTDIVARRPDGSLVTHKLLSDNPARYEDAALAGIRELLGVPRGSALPADRIAAVKMARPSPPTRSSSAKANPLRFSLTRGLRDQLRIGYQNRPRIFDRRIVLPELLYGAVYEVHERIGPRGEMIERLDVERARIDLEDAYRRGYRAAAIVLMHGYRHPEHERALADLARDASHTDFRFHDESPHEAFARGDTLAMPPLPFAALRVARGEDCRSAFAVHAVQRRVTVRAVYGKDS